MTYLKLIKVISRGITHSPQIYSFGTTDQSIAQNLISDSSSNHLIYASKLRVKLPVQSALNNNLMNRILVYYLDSNNSLIADSNVFLTTCSDPSFHLTKIGFEDSPNENSIKLSLKTHHNSTCALRVAQNKPYNSLKKINQFIERFDVQRDSGAMDKCEKSYTQRKAESYSNLSPYSVPYG